MIHSCAAMNGVRKKIIERADQLVLLSARGGDLVAACAVMKESETRDYNEAVSEDREDVPNLVLTYAI